MATKSFDQMMVIDTPEKAAALNAAYYAAKKRGPLEIDIDVDAMLRETEEFMKNNPGWLDEAIALAKERLEKEGIDISELSEED